VREVRSVVLERDAERLRELAGSRAQVAIAHTAGAAVARSRAARAPLAHQLQAGERRQRADQHRGAHALGLAHGVQHRVDAV